MGLLRKAIKELPEATLQKVQELATGRLGLESRPGKEMLLSLRTARHMRELGVSDADEYMHLLESDNSGMRLQGLMDLLTTNHTAFWREAGHFEWFREQLATDRNPEEKLTIWCAASSSGEEPYTLAMVAREALGPAAKERIRILATDVSTRMLAKARAAVYTEQRIRPLPEAWRRLYFEAGKNKWHGHLRVSREIREMVHFRWLNLVDPLPSIGPFPYIFCRNVMIYFSQETRMQIVQKLLDRLTPNGYLLVGYAEGLSGLEADTEFVRPAIYRRKSAMENGRGGAKWV